MGSEIWIQELGSGAGFRSLVSGPPFTEPGSGLRNSATSPTEDRVEAPILHAADRPLHSRTRRLPGHRTAALRRSVAHFLLVFGEARLEAVPVEEAFRVLAQRPRLLVRELDAREFEAP